MIQPSPLVCTCPCLQALPSTDLTQVACGAGPAPASTDVGRQGDQVHGNRLVHVRLLLGCRVLKDDDPRPVERPASSRGHASRPRELWWVVLELVGRGRGQGNVATVTVSVRSHDALDLGELLAAGGVQWCCGSGRSQARRGRDASASRCRRSSWARRSGRDVSASRRRRRLSCKVIRPQPLQEPRVTFCM